MTRYCRRPLLWLVRSTALVLWLSCGREVAVAGIPTPLASEIDPAPRRVSFRNDIMPLLSRSGCNMGTCHGNQNGKGGFRLSLRGDDPPFDLLSITHDQLARRVDPLAPATSLLLLKPTGTVPHEGGVRFAIHSSEARMLRSWIAAGALDDHSTAPIILSLRVLPADRILPPGQLKQPLTVFAIFSDGTTRDVTSQATIELTDPTRGSVSPRGLIEAHHPAELIVSVRYATRRAACRLAFVAEQPGYQCSATAPTHPIDVNVFNKLRDLHQNPSPQAVDSVFLRRAHLDAIGRLPTPEESRAFLGDPNPRKRDDLIDRLVNRPEFADFWALKWADLLRIEEKTMGEKGAWLFHRWLRDQIARDIPLDELVRDLITGVGSTWQNPASAFHRTNRDPYIAAESVSQVFLGVRLQCARCHNHPFDTWTQADYFSLAAFFSGIERKQVKFVLKDRFDKHQINGDEVVYTVPRAPINHPRTGKPLAPRAPGARLPIAADDPDPLDRLAEQLTSQNPQFRRNLANRAWFHLMGRGIVDPVDDFRDSNPPSNPKLLDDLTTHFEANNLRLKPLVAWIMKSQTYQSSATPNATNADDESNFSHAVVRPVPAEVLLDAISDALGVPERFAHAPRTMRAAQLPGVASGLAFLKDFGKPDRLLSCECERSESSTLAQAFEIINGVTIRRKLERSDNRIGRRIAAHASDPELLEELYLATICRLPTPTERTVILSHLARSTNRRQAWEDTAWALLSSKEFLLRH